MGNIACVPGQGSDEAISVCTPPRRPPSTPWSSPAFPPTTSHADRALLLARHARIAGPRRGREPARCALPGRELTDPAPQCVGKPWRNRAAPNACGLGFEVAPLLPLL